MHRLAYDTRCRWQHPYGLNDCIQAFERFLQIVSVRLQDRIDGLLFPVTMTPEKTGTLS